MLTCTCTRVCGCEMVPKLTRFKRRVEAPETPVRLRSGPLLWVYRFDSCHRHQAAVAQWKEHLPTKQGAGGSNPSRGATDRDRQLPETICSSDG